MKNLLSVAIIMAFSIVILSFTMVSNEQSTTPQSSDVTYEVPNNVQVILDNSCYGCHNSDSKSTKGKMKLNFDKLGDLKQGKLVSKLSRIYNAVNEQDMPPKKFISKYPDKKLSDSQTETVKEWANDLINKNGGL